MNPRFLVGSTDATDQVAKMGLELIELRAKIEELSREIERLNNDRRDERDARQKAERGRDDARDVVKKIEMFKREVLERMPKGVSARHLFDAIARTLDPKHASWTSVLKPDQYCSCNSCMSWHSGQKEHKS